MEVSIYFSPIQWFLMKKRQFSKHQYLRKLINNILHNKNKFYLKIYFKKWVKRKEGKKEGVKEGKRKGRREEKGKRERERKVTSFLESFQSSLRSISGMTHGILVHFESPGDQCWISVYSLGEFYLTRERVGVKFY